MGLIVNKTVSPHDKLIVSPTDEELSYPMMPQTVPESLLIFMGFVLPLIGVCTVCECLFKDRRDMAINALMLCQAVAVSILFTTIAKKQAGRPRPCFFEMCAWSNNVTASGQVLGCTAPMSWQWESRQSFPSGHASFSFSGLVFFSLFLLEKASALCASRRIPASVPVSLVHIAACLPAFAAVWIAITRVVDFWHNYDDILAGSVLGTATAVQAYVQRCRYSRELYEERRGGAEQALSMQSDDSANEV